MKKLFLTACFAFVGTGFLLAQTPTPTDFSEIEEFLKKSKSSRRQTMMEGINALAQKLNSLLSNNFKLLELYKDAYATVNFEGAKKEHAKVKEWEDKNKAMFKDQTFQTALRLHAQYLLATLGKRAGEDEKSAMATIQWLEFFPRAAGKWEPLAKQELLTAGIANSVFLRAVNLSVIPPKPEKSEEYVANQTAPAHSLQNWYVGDLTNLPEVHRVNVIGFLRSKRDPQIFVQWQNNLKLEQENAERDGLGAKKEYFKVHRHPWLLWQVGKDYALYGQYVEALKIMRSALEESPTCEFYEQIEAEMWKVIAESKKAKPSVAP